MPDSAASDRALIERARAGDERAFAAIVERYEPRVAATVVGMLGPGDEAEDVGQETFIRLYRYLDGYRGDASLGTYLTRIAMNLSLTALRRRKSWARRYLRMEPGARDRDGTCPGAGPGLDAIAVDASPGALDRLESSERRASLYAALEALKPEHRAVIVLRWLDGLSTQETAEALGVPEGTVMSRLSRAMDRLARQMREVAGTEGDPHAG